MKFEKYCDSFRDYLVKISFSERSTKSYLYEVKRLLRFIDQHYPRIKQITQINHEILSDYYDFLRERKNHKGEYISPMSLKQKFYPLFKFFKFLLKSDIIFKDPTVKIELPREEQRLIRNILTEEEMLEILAVPDTRTPTGLRDKAILETAYATAMRTSEIANLKINDVDLKDQTVTIFKGKGGKTRMVPLTQHATEYITRYLEKARKFLLKGRPFDEGFLFLTRNGNKFDKNSINKSVIHPIVKKTSIQKHVTYYTFRHTTASLLIKRGVDIRFVAELLGHARIDTTMIYCHLEISDLKKMHSLYHPRER